MIVTRPNLIYSRRVNSWVPDTVKARIESQYSVEFIRSTDRNRDQYRFYVHIYNGSVSLEPVFDLILSEYIIGEKNA
jgi:hypothetical protein